MRPPRRARDACLFHRCLCTASFIPLRIPASFVSLSLLPCLSELSESLCIPLYLYRVARVALRLPAGSLATCLALVALAGSPRVRTLRFDGALSHTWAFIMSLILKENSEDLYKRLIIYIKVLDSKRNTRIIHSIEFSKTGPDSSFKSSEPVV